MLPAFLPLLVCVIFKLYHLIEVVSAVLFLYVLLDEIVQAHIVHTQRIVGMQKGFSAFVDGEQGIFARRSAIMGVAGNQIGLLGHPHFLDVFHSFGILLAHEGDSFVGALDIFISFFQQILLSKCSKPHLFLFPLTLQLLSLALLFLHTLFVFFTTVIKLFSHFYISFFFFGLLFLHGAFALIVRDHLAFF